MVNSFTANQGTQSALLTDNTGGASGTLIPVMKLSIDAGGTYINPWNGNVQGGTIGSVVGIGAIPNIPGGTIGSVVGVGALPNLPVGTLGSLLGVGAIPNIPGGTIGSILGLGALPNLPGGSIVVTSIPNIPGGTIGSVIGIGSVSGLSNLPGGTLGSLLGVGAIPNIPGGTIGSVVGIGSVSGLSNLPQGSIQVTAGTFRADARTTQNILSYGTQVSGTAAIVATIIGSASVGAGTYLWLQDVSVTNNNANVLCVLGFGTAQQGTNVLLRHTLGTSGAVGIEKTLAKPANAGMTNQDLVFSLGAAGTIDLSISYFISA